MSENSEYFRNYKNCYFIDDSWPNASFPIISKLILQNLKIKIKIPQKRNFIN